MTISAVSQAAEKGMSLLEQLEGLKETLASKAAEIAGLQDKVDALAAQATDAATAVAPVAAAAAGHGDGFFMHALMVFMLALFVGYYVVWRVTPALHSPLMGVTNAISSVIVVGALIAASPLDWSMSKFFGFVAVTLASVNIFGGFIVTQRMLSMFKKKQK